MRPSAHGASACAGGVSMFTRNGNIRAQHGGGAERSKASTILHSTELGALRICGV